MDEVGAAPSKSVLRVTREKNCAFAAKRLIEEPDRGRAMFQLIGAIIIGFIVGALAKLIVPGEKPRGCLVTILLGVAGSFVAFWIGQRIFNFPMDPKHPLQPAGFLSSLAGAILILIIYHLIRRGRRP